MGGAGAQQVHKLLVCVVVKTFFFFLNVAVWVSLNYSIQLWVDKQCEGKL